MDRPRRSKRQPTKAPTIITSPPRVIKRRSGVEEHVDPSKQLKTLLQSSKSELVSMEMTDIINSGTWSMLSEVSKAHLKMLLPPTAFANYRERLGDDHPSLEDSTHMEVVDDPGIDGVRSTPPELNHGFFHDSHFLAALRTFQDHLYLNWFTEGHLEKVKEFEERTQAGTLSAPWKDEVWERDNSVFEPAVIANATYPVDSVSSLTIPCEPSPRAGGASGIKLGTLVKNGILRVGDVIAYKRTFASSEVIEKDIVIDSIHPTTHALTILTAANPTKDLPAFILTRHPSSPSEPESSDSRDQVFSMTITSLSMLENMLLDTDNRLDKSQRPNGNAWKNFSVWRWRSSAENNPHESRGGRENHGTLFYLRGSFYHENY